MVNLLSVVCASHPVWEEGAKSRWKRSWLGNYRVLTACKSMWMNQIAHTTSTEQDEEAETYQINVLIHLKV